MAEQMDGGDTDEDGSCNQWQYWESPEKTWCNMDKQFCILHDKVVRQGYRVFEYDYQRRNGSFFHYVVNLEKMTQMNAMTHTCRQIRRLVESAPYRR